MAKGLKEAVGEIEVKKRSRRRTKDEVKAE